MLPAAILLLIFVGIFDFTSNNLLESTLSPTREGGKDKLNGGSGSIRVGKVYNGTKKWEWSKGNMVTVKENDWGKGNGGSKGDGNGNGNGNTGNNSKGSVQSNESGGKGSKLKKKKKELCFVFTQKMYGVRVTPGRIQAAMAWLLNVSTKSIDISAALLAPNSHAYLFLFLEESYVEQADKGEASEGWRVLPT